MRKGSIMAIASPNVTSIATVPVKNVKELIAVLSGETSMVFTPIPLAIPPAHGVRSLSGLACNLPHYRREVFRCGQVPRQRFGLTRRH